MASQEILDWYRDQLIPKYEADLTWQQCLDAIDSLSPAEQASIITAFKAKDLTTVGKLWGVQLKQDLRSAAAAEASTALADDLLQIPEIERII